MSRPWDGPIYWDGIVLKHIDRMSAWLRDGSDDQGRLDSMVLFLYHLSRPVLKKENAFQESWDALDQPQPINDDTDQAVWNRTKRFNQFGLLVEHLHALNVITRAPKPHDKNANL